MSKKNKYNPEFIIDVALIIAIALLAGNDVNGWGWLLFILILRHL